MPNPTIDRTSSRQGSVALEVAVAAPPDRVFKALVNPVHTRQWFGVLSEPLVEGGSATLDFEDGDVFTIEDVHLEHPGRVFYRWRFLGLAPLDTIEWHIASDRDGARVTVIDTDPLRAPEWNEALREGWRDFTSRLVRYLETGDNSRYAWRREFDGAVEIGVPQTATRRLLERDMLPRWLPSRGAALESGTSWFLDDGLQPERVQIRGVKHGDEVRFNIAHPAWNATTDVTVSVRPRGSGSLLALSHNGWEHLAGDEEYGKQQRRRFAALWIAALARARTLAVSTGARA